MSLIWHIALKDLRRLRVLVALWAVLIAAKLGVGVMLIYGIGSQFDSLRFASYGLLGLEVLTGYLLVAALIHGDVLVGSTSFWMTRPVSSGRLFRGKLAGLGVLFGAIPLTLTLPWWLMCGYGVREVLLASTETVLLQGIVVCAALPLATLTDGLSRYLFWTLILVTAMIFSGITLPFVPGGGVVLVLLVFVISGIVGSVLHIFKRRHLVGVSLVGGSSGFAALIFGVVWIFNPTQSSTPSANGLNPHAADVSLSYLRAVTRGVRRLQGDLGVIIETTGVPPELVIKGSAVHRWTWSENFSLQREGDLVSQAEENASWLALGLTPSVDPTESLIPGINSYLQAREVRDVREKRSKVVSSLVFVPTAFPGRVIRDAPSYLLRADMRLMRPVVIGERPTAVGEKITSGGETSRVIHCQSYAETRQSVSGRAFRVQPASLNVRLAEHRPTIVDPVRGSLGVGPFLLSLWPERAYFLVNRERGSLARNNYSGYDAPRSRIIRIGTVGIVWRTLRWTPPAEYGQPPSWLENLSIAKIELREEERFTKELRVDHFELAPLNRATGSVR